MSRKRTFGRVSRGRPGIVMGLALAVASGCEEESAFIMSQMHRVTADADAEVPAGYTCADISSGGGSTSGGSRSDDFWMREETTTAGHFVQIGSFERVLEARFYDRAFMTAHEVDRFVVTTQQGVEYAFVYWGGDSCETCPPGPFRSLPGDPWGCASDAGVLALDP